MLGKRKELFEKLNQVIDQATNKCFYFVTKPSNQMKHMDFSHDKDGVWEEFCRGQISYFKQIDNDSDFELVDLISADERKKAIYVLDDYVNEFSNLVEIIRNVEKLLDNYANKEFDDLKLMVTRFDTLEKTNSLLTFKIIYPVQTIYKKNSISWNKGYKKIKIIYFVFRKILNFSFMKINCI